MMSKAIKVGCAAYTNEICEELAAGTEELSDKAWREILWDHHIANHRFEIEDSVGVYCVSIEGGRRGKVIS